MRAETRSPASRWAPWALWICLAVASGAGLRHYRIDNTLADWMPDLRSDGPTGTYVVAGFDRSVVDEQAVVAALRGAPSVALCIDPENVRRLQLLTGVTPGDFVIGDNGTYAGAYCFARPGIDDEAFVADLRRALAERLGEAAADVALAGPAVFHEALNRASQSRLSVIMLLVVLVGTASLWWITASASTAIAATAAVSLSQIVLVGLASWMRVPMDMSLSLVPPLMMALGYSYAAQIAMRPRITGVLLLCGITTAAGIGIFGATDLAPVRRFAAWGVLGVALVWLAVFTLVPRPARHSSPAARSSATLRATGGAAARLALRHRGPVLAVAAGITVAAAFAVGALRFEDDPLRYLPDDADMVRDVRVINDRLTGTLPFEIRVTGDTDPTEVLLATPGVRKVIHIPHFFAPVPGLYWCLADEGSLADLHQHAPEWRAWARARGSELAFTGVAAQLAHVGETIRLIAAISLPCMALVALLSGWLLTGDPRLGLVSAWVNLLPIAGLVLFAAAIRMPISIPALFVGAISIGVGLDDTIHILSEFRRTRSVPRAMVRCRLPCLGSSVTVAACMLAFTLSDFSPTGQFGLLMSIGVVGAVVADLVVLPAAILLVTRRRGAPH